MPVFLTDFQGGHFFFSKIVLQVELGGVSGGRPAIASYSLTDCAIHRRGIAQGRAVIEISDRCVSVCH